MKSWWWTLACACASSCGGTGDPAVWDRAQAAYARGAFDEARAQLDDLAAARGLTAPAALLFDLGLCALRADDLRAAETAAATAAARAGDDPAMAARCAFLIANAAYVRALRTEAQAMGPEAEPFAWQQAIDHVEAALAAWQQAVVLAGTWPAAARNIERALAKRELLRQRQKAADAQRETRREKKQAAPTPQQRVMDQLARRERQKRARRRAQTKLQPMVVEQDW